MCCSKCIDQGCAKEFAGQGHCVDIISNSNLAQLDKSFDLSQPGIIGACTNPEESEDSCCTCLKRRNCMDLGCEDSFNGLGVCISFNEDLSKYELDMTVEPKPGLCKSNFNGDCCFCYKKKGNGCMDIWSDKKCKKMQKKCKKETVYKNCMKTCKKC